MNVIFCPHERTKDHIYDKNSFNFISRFDLLQDKNLNISGTKRAIKMKQKTFFMIFECISLKQS